MNKLAQQNLAEPTPSRWIELLFHSHPAISRRVAAAEERGRAQSIGPPAEKAQLFVVRRKKEANAVAEFRPSAADPLRYPHPQNRKASRQHRLRFRSPGNAIVPAAHFSPAWIRAGSQKNRARTCGRHRVRDA